jgi:tetratricopeptide (TPR) repeat protein
MGVVYRCRDRETGDAVAVKVLPRPTPKHRERFLREAELLSTVRHPNVVRYLNHGLLETEEPYLVMEWLEGEDLEARLRRGPLSMSEAIALGCAVASALAAAHAAGVVHRDVKPANVLLVGKDPKRPRLVDFGLARAGAQRLTVPGHVLGTLGYMAPEQARGEATVDARADVFSLGCVLYECVSGRRAFDGDSAMAILTKVLLEEPPPLRSLVPSAPLALEHTIARMLAKAREERYASAMEVAHELRRLDDGSSERELPPLSSLPRVLTTRERRLLCLIVARRGAAPAAGATLLDPRDEEDVSRDGATTPSPEARELARALGSLPEVLVDGSLVAVVEGSAAVDQAVCAARAALRLRSLAAREGRPMQLALATGRGELDGAVPFGDVVDRACAMLESAPAEAGVRIDAATSALLETRFVIATDEYGALLTGERPAESARLLMGRTAPFVGRDREFGALLALYQEAKEERTPRLAILTGAAGIGKSRVQLELGERIRADGACWLIGGGDVAQPGAPFRPIQTALRRELGLGPELPVESRRSPVSRRLSSLPESLASRLAPMLAQLAGLPFDEKKPALRRDVAAVGDGMRAAWQDFLEAEGERRPVVLVLEDMQWGDRPSITLATAALRALKDTPLFVLVTGRPELHGMFPELVASPGATQIDLAPLGARASARLVRGVLDADEPTVERIVHQAAGNPFLLEELARGVALGRGIALPETVLAMAQARLEELSPGLRRVLRAAAVLGDSFTESGLSMLLVDVGARELHERLEELVDEEVLDADPTLSGRYRFRQVILREASYASLTASDRALAHGLAARFLAAQGSADPFMLATHLERAGKSEQAAVYYLEAATQSFEGHDVDGTLARIDRACACGARGETLGRLLLLRSEAQYKRGQCRDARDAAHGAAELLPEWTAHWLAAKVVEAMAGMHLADAAAAIAVAEALCVRLEQGDASPAVFYSAGQISNILSGYRVPSDVALRLVSALSTALPRCTDDRALGAVYGALMADAVGRADLEDAVEFGESSCAALMRAGDLRDAGYAYNNVGYALSLLGQWERAEAALRTALAIAERLGAVAQMAAAQQNLGFVLACLGNLEAGESLERRSVHSYETQSNKRAEVGSRYYLGRILLMRGHVAEAVEQFRRASEDAKSVPAIRPLIDAGRAFALLSAGDVDAAYAVARGAVAAATERKWQVEQPLTVLLSLVEVQLVRGEDAAARASLAEIVEELDRIAGRLRDPAVRQSFLTRVPEHARILRLRQSLEPTHGPAPGW